jgi:hypothetical protein
VQETRPIRRGLRAEKSLLVAAVVAGGLFLSCTDSALSLRNDPREQIDVSFIDAVVVPVPWAKARVDPSVGAIVSLRLANDGPAPVTITDVVPIVADGLEASVLGHSDCDGGCVGTGRINPQTIRRAEQSLDGGHAFTLSPESPTGGHISVVFRLSIEDAAVARREHCLELEGVTAKFSDGSSHVLRSAGSGSIAAIEPQGTKGTACLEALHSEN